MAPRDEDVDVEAGGSPPGAPHLLEITDFDSGLVRLKWKAPLTEGGQPVTFYVVEFQQRGEEEW